MVINAVTISFFAILLAYVAIGVYSATQRKNTTDDYLVASRSINPWLAALSAVATDNSGFMFIGLTGSCYLAGVSGAWLIIGWIIGEWFAWRWVHGRLRTDSEKAQVNTITSYLGHGMKGGIWVARFAALVTLVFLGVYASAQLNAGAKALAPFDIDHNFSVILGATVVLIYCFAGGLRASIWTDAAQSVVMLVSMALLVGVAIAELGGPGEFWDKLGAVQTVTKDGAVNAGLTDWIPDTKLGFPLFLAGWIAAGFGMIGQPHIMIRAMAIDSADNMPKARRIYLTWYVFFAAACVMVGLVGRLIIPLEMDVPSELIFGTLSQQLLPSVLIGVMLAGVFAATVSTADSQVLSSSAAITQDLVPSMGQSYTKVKLGTVVVTGAALLLAFWGGSVFKYVTFAWSALAATMAPLMVVRVMGWRIDSGTALRMMASGLAVSAYWLHGLHWDGYVFQALPGMAAGFLVYFAHIPWLTKSDG